MPHTILFFHGAGEGAWEADAKLAESLRAALGPGYVVRNPPLPDEDNPDVGAWTKAIAEEIAAAGPGVMLAGHSFGGSVIARALSDGIGRDVGAVFLISAPFWGGDTDWDLKAAELPHDVAKRFPDVPVFLYHGSADETVPVAHVERFAKLLPKAKTRRLAGRNHQLDDDLGEVAEDIKALG